MAESFGKENENKHNKYKNIQEAFEKTTGIEVPLNPESAPDEIVLPLNAVGDMFKYLETQRQLMDTNPKQASGREWSQAVGLLNTFGNLSNDSVFIKREDIGEIGLFETMGETKRWLRPLVLSERKPITYWHIHPPRLRVETTNNTEGYWKYGAIFSNGDVVQRVSEDRKCFAYVLGAPDGIKVILQTKQAIPDRIPLSTTQIGMAEMEEVYKIYTNRAEKPDEAKLAEYLKTKGYVMYEWKNDNKSSSVTTSYKNGEFANGIPLKQIGQPPSV